MSKNKYDNQKITDYLLGNLSETETEHFDELGFVDDDFANQLNVVEKDLVDSYVKGELSGERLNRFKSYYLATPLRREKVEVAESLQIFIDKKHSEVEKEELVIASEKTNANLSRFSSFFPFLANPKAAMQLGVIAILLLFFVVGIWFIALRPNQQLNENIVQKTPTPQTDSNVDITPKITPEPMKEIAIINENVEIQPTPNPESTPIKTPKPTVEPKTSPSKPTKTPPKVSLATFVFSPPVRGGSKVKQITIPENIRDVAITLQLEFDDFQNYRTALIDQTNGKSLWQSGKLNSKKTSENNSINIRFSAKLLENKIYLIRVSGIYNSGQAEVISSYPFRVTKSNPKN